MKKILIILAIIIMFLVYSKSEAEEIIIIPDKSLRFRVIANSNNLNDFITKNEVKKEVEKELIFLLKDAKTIDETKQIINENIVNIKEKISKNIDEKNLDFNIKLGLNYFPKKIFKGVIYNEGEYESLIITLGKGNGENWWCVLFPPLCLLEENPNTSDVEYQLYVTRIINHFK